MKPPLGQIPKNEMKRYTIGLITGILLTASALPLIAQGDASGLTLEKNGEQVLIHLGEWVAASSAYDSSNTVRGIYLGMTVDALRIQEKGESFEDKIFTAKGIDPLTDDRISPFFILNKLKEKDQSE